MAADEAVLNIVGKKNKKSPQKIFFLKICVFEFNLATINNMEGSTLTKKSKSLYHNALYNRVQGI